MSVQGHASFDNHTEVLFVCDPSSGLRGIIALHRVWQRPSVGGCRLKIYGSEDEALDDVLRLSRGMTYKSVMAGLAYGGAKAVIVSAPEEHERKAQMRAMARITDRLGGRFRTGVDFGLTPDDIDAMQEETSYVFGDAVVPPSEATAKGVLISMKSAVRSRLGRTDFRGMRIMVQGLGKVGMPLSKLLAGEGAIVQVADVHEKSVETACRDLGATAVPTEQAHAADVDIFCPCALGAVLNDRTISELRASVVVGSANNQLAAPRHGDMLHERGVLYAPDYIVNAGGLIAVAAELEHETSAWIDQKLGMLSETLANVFDTAEKRKINTGLAADLLAEQRIAACEHSGSSSDKARQPIPMASYDRQDQVQALRPIRKATG